MSLIEWILVGILGLLALIAFLVTLIFITRKKSGISLTKPQWQWGSGILLLTVLCILGFIYWDEAWESLRSALPPWQIILLIMAAIGGAAYTFKTGKGRKAVAWFAAICVGIVLLAALMPGTYRLARHSLVAIDHKAADLAAEIEGDHPCPLPPVDSGAARAPTGTVTEISSLPDRWSEFYLINFRDYELFFGRPGAKPLICLAIIDVHDKVVPFHLRAEDNDLLEAGLKPKAIAVLTPEWHGVTPVWIKFK